MKAPWMKMRILPETTETGLMMETCQTEASQRYCDYSPRPSLTGGKVCSVGGEQPLRPAARLQHSGWPAESGGEDDGHGLAPDDNQDENNHSPEGWGHSPQNQTRRGARHVCAHEEIRFAPFPLPSKPLWSDPLTDAPLSSCPLLSGLSSLFEDANLCGLYSEDRLLLDDVRHRAFLALTDQGVEAVAVSSATFSRTYNSFSALQPFVFLLWSDQANVPLFVGRVIDLWGEESQDELQTEGDNGRVET